MITETDPSSVQPSQAFAENPKNFTTPLLPDSGDEPAGPPVGQPEVATPGAHGAPNTAPACSTTPTLADLGVLYGGRDRLLSVSEVAEHLGISIATVYKICKRGDLPHVRIIDSIRIRPSDLAAFADTGGMIGHRRRSESSAPPALPPPSPTPPTTPSSNASASCRSRSTSYPDR